MAKYITPEEFLAYTGINLKNISDDDNPSNKVEALLNRTEIRIIAYLSGTFRYDFDYKYSRLDDEHKGYFKNAVMEQVLYVINNTDIMSDSGYDPEKGILATQEQLKHIALSFTVKNMLMMSGLWDRNVTIGGDYNGWFY